MLEGKTVNCWLNCSLGSLSENEEKNRGEKKERVMERERESNGIGKLPHLHLIFQIPFDVTRTHVTLSALCFRSLSLSFHICISSTSHGKCHLSCYESENSCAIETRSLSLANSPFYLTDHISNDLQCSASRERVEEERKKHARMNVNIFHIIAATADAESVYSPSFYAVTLSTLISALSIYFPILVL